MWWLHVIALLAWAGALSSAALYGFAVGYAESQPWGQTVDPAKITRAHVFAVICAAVAFTLQVAA